jgi:hypothetical protein
LSLIVAGFGCGGVKYDSPPPSSSTTSAPAAPPSTAPAKPDPNRPALTQRRTDDVRESQAEQERGARVMQPGEARGKSAIGNVYVTSVSRIAELSIQARLETFNAIEGRYPESHEEFMEKVIRGADPIALPALPPNQKYAYNVAEHKLEILVYPEGVDPNATAPVPDAPTAPAANTPPPPPLGGGRNPLGLDLPGGS